MRKLKRFIRRLIAEWKNRSRRNEVLREISAVIGEKVTLRQSGSRGADSIYEIFSGSGQRIAVLRLLNPFRKKKTAPSNMPYVILDGADRIQREAQAYEGGAQHGLTPTLLWSSSDALACNYFAGQPILDSYMRGELSASSVVEIGWNLLSQLHELRIVHMDASVQNVLVGAGGTNAVAVDFEFGAASDLSYEDQCLYDYLRYLESLMKFLSPEEERQLGVQLRDLSDIPADVLNADLDRLCPALERLSASQSLWSAITKMIGKSV